MRESTVEKYLVKRVKENGGETRKVKWIGRRGAPDRIVMLNGAHFVEVKRPGEVPEAHQIREMQRMQDKKVSVDVVSNFEEVDDFIATVLCL